MEASETVDLTGPASVKTAPPKRAAVEIVDVQKVFQHAAGPVEVFNGIDCSFTEGEFVAFLGPSGCGKSTLLRMVAGLVEPTRGTVRVDGAEVTRPPDSMGMVFQEDALLEWRTVMDNVVLPAEIRKTSMGSKEIRARAMELLEQVGLEGFAEAWPAQLSGGMKQRAALCQALFRRPKLLLMDEPFGALDALTREQMQRDLQQVWLTERNTVLFVTHSISEAVWLADRVLVFSPRPTRILADLRVDLPRPRDERTIGSPQFGELTRYVYELFRREGVLH
jgi:NitT/TauT family transport system ATP-binding protein